jgi:hypothetical protein
MKFSHVLFAGVLAAALPLRAVYAPIPEQEQGKDLTTSIRAGWSYDSNIFGGASDAISSNIWEVAPRIIYNASLDDQTFFSANYGLILDEIENRPGQKLLDSHDLTLRLAHAFSKTTTIDLNDVVMLSRNPESLLNGVPVNTDQSFTRNQADGRYETSLNPKVGIEVKARSVYTRYRNGELGRSLDRIENLYGLAGNYAVLPEVKAVSEYRHLDVYYRKLGEIKNKSSDYFMVGADYEAAKKLTLSTRFGAEWRQRSSESSTTAPYAELSGRYQYGEHSSVTGGYAYTLDEPSDTARFTDEKVNRLFINVEHSLTALIVASASVDYEPAVLQGRRSLGVPNLNETTNRLGGALTYLPTKNWTIAATYDYDHVNSDDPSRRVERHRVGLSASYTF